MVTKSRWTVAALMAVVGSCAFGRAAVAQDVSSYALPLRVSIQSDPPVLTLSWPFDTKATSYVVERKGKDDQSWGRSVALPGDAGSYLDTDVQPGTGYEYHVMRATTNDLTHAYIYTGLGLPLVESRGAAILVVDNSLSSGLAAELDRLRQDLVGDGWTVLRHDVPRMRVEAASLDPALWLARSNEVSAVKGLIKADYLADPANVSTVFLIGHVPVPYSGALLPDQHLDHRGAWPADVYYGDMEGIWTDTSVTSTNAADPRNLNVPGDGKFDATFIPGNVALGVGRVDMANLPAFPQSELELVRQYLNKDHNFRQRVISAQRRELVDDNFGVLGDEIPAVNAWANGAALFGDSNTTAGFWLSALSSQDYLWAYGSGSGTYISAAGVADSTHFIVYDLKAVFTTLFGSYFGDWDSSNNLLRAVLTAPSYTLTSAWVGRPYWYFHHMALGETIGFSTRLTQNNRGLYRSYEVPGIRIGFPGERQYTNAVHIALMGDPTLRLHPVIPPGLVAAATNNSGNVVLYWTPSTDPVLGYNVYRAVSTDGPFRRLNDALITTVTYTDTAETSERYYMVRAVRLETSPSGSYYNASQGAFAQAPQVPSANADSTWAGGDVRNWTVRDVQGDPDSNPGWDTVRLTTAFALTASATSQFTVRIISLAPDGGAGAPAHFDPDQAYAWPILVAPTSITGFDLAKINLVTGEFQGDLRGGSFRLELSPDGKAINLVFVPNHPPVATAAVFTRAWDTPFRIGISDLIAQFTSDPDGDGRALTQVGSSTNGTSITIDGPDLVFNSPNNVPETVSYWVQDVRPYRPGDTLRLASSTITITPLPKSASTTAYHAIEIEWQGDVGKLYQLQFRPDTDSPWTNEGTPMPGTGQKASIFRRSSDATKFYRVIELP